MTGQIPTPTAYPQAGYQQTGYQQAGYPQQGYAATPYGAQPYGTPVYRAPSPMSGVMAKIFSGNPIGAVMTGATAVLMALVLSLIGALVINTSIVSPNTDGVSGFGIRPLLGMLMGSIFGAKMGFTDTLSTRSDYGAGQYAITLGAMPLGFAILTLAITILVWRRATARHTSVVPVIIDAIIAALVSGIVMLIVAIATGSTISTRYGGLLTGDTGESAKIGPSAAGAFFSTFLILLIVLLLAGLAGRNFFPGKAAPFAQAISNGLAGFFAFAIALPVLGLIIGLIASSVPAIDGMSLFDGSGLGGWTASLVLAIIAYSGNIGLWAATLGSFGNVQFTGNGGTQPFSMSDLANPNMVGGAIWAALVVPILALIIGAIVASRNNPTRNIALGAFGAFCVSLLALVPILGSFANFHGLETMSGSVASQFEQNCYNYYDCTPFGSLLDTLGLPTSYSGNSMAITFGAGLVGATFMMFLFALVISFLVALATGVITTSQLGAVQGRAMQALNVTPAAPQGYGYPQQPAYGYQPQPETWAPQPVPQPMPQPMAQPAPMPQPVPMPQSAYAPQPMPQQASRFQGDVPPPPPEYENVDDTIVAPLSATLLPPPPPEESGFACPACGTPQPAGVKFCDKCGTPLGYQAG